MHWALFDGRGNNFFPESERDLIAALEEVNAAARRDGVRVVATLSSDIDAEVAPYLTLVLGDDESVLTYDDGDNGPDSGISVGPNAGDTPELVAAYGTGHMEYQRWMVIPTKDAYAATQEFFRTGIRPTNIELREI
jgi:hypothetical protein